MKRTTVLLLGLAISIAGLPTAPEALAAPGVTNPITYVYDEAGRLTASIDPTAASNQIAKYVYDPAGNITRITRTAITTTPAIVDFHPHTTATGTPITIYGAAFNSTPAQNIVTFTGGATATATAASTTTATVTVPAGAQAGTIKIKNNANGLTSPLSSQSWSAPAAAPSISNLSPTKGLPWSTLTITGSGFSTVLDRNTVTINQTRARVITASATQLTVEVSPVGSSGAVQVRTPNGVATATQDFFVQEDTHLPATYVHASRLASGVPTHIALNVNGDTAVLVFSATKGQTFVLDATTETVPDSRWAEEVYDPFGIQIGGGEFDRFTARITGDYAYVIENRSASGTGTADVTMTLVDVAVGPTVTPTFAGQLITLSKAFIGQEMTMIVNGNANQDIRIDTREGLGFSGDAGLNAPWQPDGPAGAYGTWTESTLASGIELPEAGKYFWHATSSLMTTPPWCVWVEDISDGNPGSIPSCPSSLVGGGGGGGGDEETYAETEAEVAQAVAAYDAGPEAWAPDPAHPELWETGRERSPFEGLRLPSAPEGTTALTGRLLRLNGIPLPGATVTLSGISVTTDRTGAFLLEDVPTGEAELIVDGRTASDDERSYGVFEVGVDIEADRTNTLGFTVWMPLIDPASVVHVDSYPLAEAIVLTNPTMPGFQVQIPRGATITDEDGEDVYDLSLTPVPLDRVPFPMPDLNPFSMHFMLQPGDAYVDTGFRIIYPNNTNLAPGSRADVWTYEPEEGWETYGQAQVSRDGRRIVPDPGVRAYGFQGASLSNIFTPIATAACNLLNGSFHLTEECSIDPVSYSNGLLDLEQTDLVEPGPMPIEIERIYAQNDSKVFDAGLGFANPYDLYLASTDESVSIDLWVPGEGITHFVPPPGETNVPMYTSSGVGDFVGAEIDIPSGSGSYIVRRRDGVRFQFSNYGVLNKISDRYGNALVINRPNETGSDIDSILSLPSGRWVSMTHDTGSPNVITQILDQSGRGVSYAYERPGTGIVRMTSVTDPNQQGQPTPAKTTFAWSTDLTMCSNPCANVPASHLTDVWDRRGNHQQTIHYDAQGRVDVQTFANGGQFTFQYASTDPACLGGTKVTAPDGVVTCALLAAGGQFVSQVTTALGTPLARTLAYTRDATTERLTEILDSFTTGGSPVSRRTTFTYDANGILDTMTTRAGTPQAATWSYDFDRGYVGLKKVIDPLAHNREMVYSFPDGCLTRIEDDLNRGVTLTCQGNGLVKDVTDDLTDQTTFTYAGGYPIKATDPLGNTMSMYWDGAGNLEVLSDANYYATTFVHDKLGNLTTVTPPVGSSTTFHYDAAENLDWSRLDSSSATTTYQYTELNLLWKRTDSLAKVDTYTYDLAGRLATVIDRRDAPTANRTTAKYCYNALGLVEFVGYRYTGAPAPACNSTYTSTTSYSYDGAGRMLQATDSVAGQITRTYDLLDRMLTETNPQGGLTYTYDAADRRQTMTVTGQPVVNYTYFTNDLLNTITRSGKVVTQTYDAANRLDTTTLPNLIVEDWIYDASSRLTATTYKKGTTTFESLTYGYDRLGRRTGIYGSSARLTLPTATTTDAVYDAANRLSSWNGTTIGYDPNGSMTSNGSQTYAWNERNQLTATSGGTSTFAYDGLGRRTQKVTSGATTRSLYDGLNPVQEKNGAGTVTANSIAGLGVDQVFWRNAGSTPSNILIDGLGSTLALYSDAATPANQTNFTYEPYGKATASVGSFATFPHQFTGRDQNAATGLQHNRARYYAYGHGRFISEDPMGLLSSTTNRYHYSAGAPTVFSDPLGLFPVWQVATIAVLAVCMVNWTACLVGVIMLTVAQTLSLATDDEPSFFPDAICGVFKSWVLLIPGAAAEAAALEGASSLAVLGTNLVTTGPIAVVATDLDFAGPGCGIH